MTAEIIFSAAIGAMIGFFCVLLGYVIGGGK